MLKKLVKWNNNVSVIDTFDNENVDRNSELSEKELEVVVDDLVGVVVTVETGDTEGWVLSFCTSRHAHAGFIIEILKIK